MTIAIKLRTSFLTFSMSLCAAFLSVSISLQQIFFAVSLLFWFISVVLIQTSQSQTIVEFPAFRWREYYWFVVAWFVWRSAHIIISPYKSEEAFQARELWLFFMIPLLGDLISPQIKKIYSGQQESTVLRRNSLTKDTEVLSNGQQWLGYNTFFWVLLALVFGGALVGAFNFFQFLIVTGGDIIIYRAAALNNFNPLTYSGTAALTMVICGGLFISLLRHNVYRSSKVVAKTYLFIVAICLLFSIIGFILARSRGGYIAFFLLICFLSVVLLRKKVIWGWIVLISLTATLWFTSPKFQDIFYAAIPAKGSHSGTVAERFDLWQAGIAMLKDRPLVGYGDAEYTVAYQKYKVKNAMGTADTGSHMHNDLLNTAVLYGGVGLIIFLGFFFWPLWDYLKMHADTRKHPLWPLMVSGLAGIAFMFFMGLSQCHFTDEEVQLAFWMCIGVFYGIRDRILEDLEGV